MSNQYLINNYKGRYRILPVICRDTNDFPRNAEGEIEKDAEVYIACANDAKIEAWGLNDSRRMLLLAYIPSIGRGRNVKRELKKLKVELIDYDESDEEVMFKFKATDIDTVAKVMKAKTYGANISPFSNKNLPKADVCIPQQDMDLYKAISSKVGTAGMSVIRDANKRFMDEILAIKLKKSPRSKKPHDYRKEMKELKMSRMTKEYIHSKGFWSEYLAFLSDEVDKYLANK